MDLPPPIQTYLDADKKNDGEALIQAFAADAVVRDEGQTHVGRDAIEKWWRGAKAQYHHAVEPLDAVQNGDAVNVRAKVTGEFPGSPAVLVFAFRHRTGEITHLDIGA
ncbi:nuclear transport factor 2 family protein [Methyloligella solikamskensis]|uniref:Nuclear transport factor 2 family protein n=1 Tax=Methyloligella solikamskensis TaxID=1177756 RepID=A0ABW3J859_9HYPH